MKKKMLSALVSAGLCVGLLTGCNNSATQMPSYKDYVTLGEYVGIEYTLMSAEVTEEDIQEQIDSFLQQCGTTTELTEGTVKDGDTINLDYIGYADGEAFEGGDTEGAGAELTIGSNSYIDDFEEQLIGHEVGEEGIEVNVTFPDDYTNYDGTPSDMAGKDATFICTINSIYETTYPEEITDELVAENTSYDTVNSFKDALRMEYETYKQEAADQQMQADIITAVMNNATVSSYPEDEVKEMTDKTIQAAKDTAESYGVDYETYLSFLQDEEGNAYTTDTYAADAEEYIREVLAEKMVVCMIAEEQGISVTEEEVQTYVETECATYTGMDAETIYETYSMQDLAYAVLYDEVMEYLIENAIAIEE